jgi:hypothetical protein
MKRTFILILLFALFIDVKAQVSHTRKEFKTLVQTRSIYLNGGARAAFGGKSRISIPIYLPENTISWYYSFTTSPGESGIANLNLLTQLSALTLGPAGLSRSLLSSLEIPPGSGSVDIYLLDSKNEKLFLSKADQNGSTFSYFQEGSVENTRDGIVDITHNISGTRYIGLRNPSMMDAVNVSIEVVALVEVDLGMTEQESRSEVLGNLGWKAFERGDYDNCIELSKKALTLDNAEAYLYFNIALCLLIKGQSADASEIYSKGIAMAKKSTEPKENLASAVDDLLKYMDKIVAKDVAHDLIDLLIEEEKNY